MSGFYFILALPLVAFTSWFYPVDWGKAILLRIIISILMCMFAWQFLYKKTQLSIPRLKRNIIFWLLCGLFLIYCIASIFSLDPQFSLWGSPYRAGGFITYACYIVFAILLFIIARRQDWEKLWNFSIGTGVIVSFIALAQYIFKLIPETAGAKPISTIGNSVPLTIYLLFLVWITLAYALKETVAWKKIFYWGALALFGLVIFISFQRAAFVGLTIGAVYFVFFLPHPKKWLKISVGIFLVLVGLVIVYANVTGTLPKLSIQSVLSDSRFSVWRDIEIKMLKEKPLLGWGPENFFVGFDTFYNPAIFNPTTDSQYDSMNNTLGTWWDRAHNNLLQTGIDAGIVAMIIYLVLFGALFYKLGKVKKIPDTPLHTMVVIHALQATLLAYFCANFFSVDDVPTYLLFFVVIGYSLHLIYPGTAKESHERTTSMQKPVKIILVSLVFCAAAVFIWHYNLVPLYINAMVNKSQQLVEKKNCDQGLHDMDALLQKHSFLDSYIRNQYIEFEKQCIVSHPENAMAYAQRGLDVLQEAVTIQPLYTRYWLWAGTLATTLAESQEDQAQQHATIQQAGSYLHKAAFLAPQRQEIMIAEAKLQIDAEDYHGAQTYATTCINLNPRWGDCWWYLALSQIYLNDTAHARENIQYANDRGFNVDSQERLVEIANAYGVIHDYKNLIVVFEELASLNPTVAEYHTWLAQFYEKLGRYADAQKEAQLASQLSPQK